MSQTKWALGAHSIQIADTGDSDGHYELTIGKFTLHSTDEVEDDEWEKLQEAISTLNKIPMEWYDPSEGCNEHIIEHQKMNSDLQLQFIEEKGLTEEFREWEEEKHRKRIGLTWYQLQEGWESMRRMERY